MRRTKEEPMKIRATWFALALTPWLTISAEAATGCAGKLESLRFSLDDAKAAGDQERIRGLEKAIDRVAIECDDNKLLADREERVAEKRREVAEDEEDLLKAEREGDWGDIEDAKRDLAESRWELQEAEAELAR
jgi:hypothetical protein